MHKRLFSFGIVVIFGQAVLVVESFLLAGVVDVDDDADQERTGPEADGPPRRLKFSSQAWEVMTNQLASRIAAMLRFLRRCAWCLSVCGLVSVSGGSAVPKAHHGGGRMREWTLSFEQGCHFMDVEHINAIGNRLADLSRRTVDLRGYL